MSEVSGPVRAAPAVVAAAGRARRFGRASALVPAVLALVTFAMLLALVLAEFTVGIDRRGIMLFQSDPVAAAAAGLEAGPGWFRETARDFTALGSNGVLGALCVTVAGFLVLRRQWRAAVALAGCFAGTLAVVAVLKVWVARTRPDLVPDAAKVFTSSFPSSHAAMSAALCCVGALLVWQRRPEPLVRAFAAAAAAWFVVVIGLSRVVLGVHWPSDVLAGWTLGLGCAGLWWRMLHWGFDGGSQPVHPEGSPGPRRASTGPS